jgi:hypothetical protein
MHTKILVGKCEARFKDRRDRGKINCLRVEGKEVKVVSGSGLRD